MINSKMNSKVGGMVEEVVARVVMVYMNLKHLKTDITGDTKILGGSMELSYLQSFSMHLFGRFHSTLQETKAGWQKRLRMKTVWWTMSRTFRTGLKPKMFSKRDRETSNEVFRIFAGKSEYRLTGRREGKFAKLAAGG